MTDAPRALTRTDECKHEDVMPHCPFGCGETVDSDTQVCSSCKEGVAPIMVCIYCDEEVTQP